ncbi:hypothetical protein DMN91_011322 [Ooceraea biroi]|uniref:Uncharacterized protein n=1 Tax=Ooceraea biroi TaxID=2015173 RepID=A0A3L8DAU0_OOCBI|nr:hypothetical protein DMN91_011322 [Ooceraea biroi]
MSDEVHVSLEDGGVHRVTVVDVTAPAIESPAVEGQTSYGRAFNTAQNGLLDPTELPADERGERLILRYVVAMYVCCTYTSMMLHPAWMNAMNVSTKIARRFSALRTAFSFARFMQQLKRWGPRNSSVTVERAVQAEYVANAMLDPRTPFATVVLASVGLPGDPESRGCFKPVLAEYIRRHFDIFPTRLVSNTARSHAWSLVRSTGTALKISSASPAAVTADCEAATADPHHCSHLRPP